MSSDDTPPRPEEPGPSFSYDDGARLTEVREIERNEGSPEFRCAYGPQPRNSTSRVAHDKESGLFVLTWSEDIVEHVRDQLARPSMLERDPQAGAIGPVTDHVGAAYVYVCREEGETL
jgi:hypothetical protein